jgi:hypothetical protein
VIDVRTADDLDVVGQPTRQHTSAVAVEAIRAPLPPAAERLFAGLSGDELESMRDISGRLAAGWASRFSCRCGFTLPANIEARYRAALEAGVPRLVL